MLPVMFKQRQAWRSCRKGTTASTCSDTATLHAVNETPDKMRSVSGCPFFIAGGLVHFSRQLQRISAHQLKWGPHKVLCSADIQLHAMREDTQLWLEEHKNIFVPWKFLPTQINLQESIRNQINYVPVRMPFVHVSCKNVKVHILTSFIPVLFSYNEGNWCRLDHLGQLAVTGDHSK